MISTMSPKQTRLPREDARTFSRLSLNHSRNKEQDHTRLMDEAAAAFRYEDCKDSYWNPERFSLLYGTPLWDEASPSQRVILNQLYWVAYYAQIISAEIATIFLNQTSAAGLYTLEDFRLVCDTLDLETSQERAHINAFKTVGEGVEAALFGERVFTYPMRSMYGETMVFADADRLSTFWRRIQLGAYTLLSSGNAFIACQYFTVRGLRTLNGKIVQHALSQFYRRHPAPDNAPIPAKISYYHFMDESYHFNSSSIVSHDILGCLKPPTRFESWVANRALWGCQKDHFNFSTAINGIFWYDPALFAAVYRILRAPAFGLDDGGAKRLLDRCFAEESQGMHESFKTHRTAVESYKAYLADLAHVDGRNKTMALMGTSTLEGHLETNRAAYADFLRNH